jgi:hypothetical protein
MSDLGVVEDTDVEDSGRSTMRSRWCQTGMLPGSHGRRLSGRDREVDLLAEHEAKAQAEGTSQRGPGRADSKRYACSPNWMSLGLLTGWDSSALQLSLQCAQETKIDYRVSIRQSRRARRLARTVNEDMHEGCQHTSRGLTRPL